MKSGIYVLLLLGAVGPVGKNLACRAAVGGLPFES